MFTGRHLGDIQRWAILADEGLKQYVGLFQLFLKLLPTFIGIFAKQSQGALKITCGMLLIIDIMLFQQTIEVGDLRDNTDRADDGKRRGIDGVSHTGHHITATRGHLVDADGQRDLGAA